MSLWSAKQSKRLVAMLLLVPCILFACSEDDGEQTDGDVRIIVDGDYEYEMSGDTDSFDANEDDYAEVDEESVNEEETEEQDTDPDIIEDLDRDWDLELDEDESDKEEAQELEEEQDFDDDGDHEEDEIDVTDIEVDTEFLEETEEEADEVEEEETEEEAEQEAEQEEIEPILCDADFVIECGQTLYRNNETDGSARLDEYNCGFLEQSGPEVIFELNLPSAGLVTADLTDMTQDLDLFLLDECNSLTCLKRSSTLGNEQIRISSQEENTYYFVVDGYYGNVSSFSLSIECQLGVDGDVDDPPDGDDDSDTGPCVADFPLICGQSYEHDSSIHGSMRYNEYDCSGLSATGPEVIYHFISPDSCDVTIQVTDLSDDLDLFGLNSCNPNSCFDYSFSFGTGDEELSMRLDAGEQRFFSVDGWSGNSGSYTITANCDCGSTDGDVDEDSIESEQDEDLEFEEEDEVELDEVEDEPEIDTEESSEELEIEEIEQEQLPCGEENERIDPASGQLCCEGLTWIEDESFEEVWDDWRWIWTCIDGEAGYCTYCGDGVCSPPENVCNCMRDCPLSGGRETR